MGYRKSTPINVLLAESCEPRIVDRIEYLAFNYISITVSQCNHPLINIFNNLQEIIDNPTRVTRISTLRLYECYNIFLQIAHLFYKSEIPVFCSYPYPHLKFFLPQVSFEEGELLKEDTLSSRLFNILFLLQTPLNHYFTDGSKIENLSFAGFAVYDRNQNICYKKRTSNRASIFTCEAMAILIALQKCDEDTAQEIYIFSDSRNVLEAICSTKYSKKRSHLVWKILYLIHKLKSKDKEIKLFWIPAHVGIEFNELVDKSAKEAAVTGVDVQLSLPISDSKTLWKENLFKKFWTWAQDNHKGNHKGNHKEKFFFQHFFKPSRKPWFYKHNISRKTIVSINRLRSGHTSLAESLWSHNIIESPKCECGDNQNSEHIFWKCSLITKERETFLQTISSQISTDTLNTMIILQTNNNQVLNALEKFICSIPFRI